MQLRRNFEVITLLGITVFCDIIGGSLIEEQLQDSLFKDYNKHVRPAIAVTDVTEVDFILTLLQIISVAEKSEEMTTSQYITLRWHDSRLSWKPEKFGGIQTIRLPSKIIWKPDLALSNNIDGYYDKTIPVNALLNYTGEVEWMPPAIYRSSCSIRVEYFPFDWQNCTLRFRSFTYGTKEIWLHSVYSKAVVDKEAYTDNGEWKVIHCPVRVNHDPGDEDYQDITLYFIIQRKPLFYIINIIIPCVLISSLSVLVFYLPSGCSEKTNMSISVLLGLPVYLLLLAKRVPETSLGVPLIGAYLLFTMLSVTFSVIFSVIVLNVYHRSPAAHEMKPWIRTIFIEFLPPLLHMNNTVTPRPSEACNQEAEMKKEQRVDEKLNTKKKQEQSENQTRKSSSKFQFSFDRVTEYTLDNVNSCDINVPNHNPKCSNSRSMDKDAKQDTGSKSKHIRKRFEEKSLGIQPPELRPMLSDSSRETHLPFSDSRCLFPVCPMDVKEELSSQNIPPNEGNFENAESDYTDLKQTASNDIRIQANGECRKLQLLSGPREYFKLSCDEKRETFRKSSRNTSSRKGDSMCGTDAYFHIDASRSQGGDVRNSRSTDVIRLAENLAQPIHFDQQINRFTEAYENIKSRPTGVLGECGGADTMRGIYPSSQTATSVRNRRTKAKEAKTSPTVKYVIHKLPDKTNECLDAVNFICQHVRDENDYKVKMHEWQMVATVIDRLTFWIFLFVYFAGSLYFALQALTNIPPDHPFLAGDQKYAQCWSDHELKYHRGRSFY